MTLADLTPVPLAVVIEPPHKATVRYARGARPDLDAFGEWLHVAAPDVDRLTVLVGLHSGRYRKSVRPTTPVEQAATGKLRRLDWRLE